ncbi:hypothetical protein [Pelotomaculum schinkii]|uniref:hypothetical protein n=1 Tax=Pelotomaculum schinkii TaxID=78350 RepID=UPI00167E4B61|nr:hypothetical protein [Pelotomaculum schinkii]
MASLILVYRQRVGAPKSSGGWSIDTVFAICCLVLEFNLVTVLAGRNSDGY